MCYIKYMIKNKGDIKMNKDFYVMRGVGYIREGEFKGQKFVGIYKKDVFEFVVDGEIKRVPTRSTLPMTYGQGIYAGLFVEADRFYQEEVATLGTN